MILVSFFASSTIRLPNPIYTGGLPAARNSLSFCGGWYLMWLPSFRKQYPTTSMWGPQSAGLGTKASLQQYVNGTCITQLRSGQSIFSPFGTMPMHIYTSKLTRFWKAVAIILYPRMSAHHMLNHRAKHPKHVELMHAPDPLHAQLTLWHPDSVCPRHSICPGLAIWGVEPDMTH